MKKFLMTVVFVIVFFICVTGLVACGETNSSGDEKILSVYNTYVAYAEENGIAPLSYENWLATIKGEKGEQGVQGEQGVGISSVRIDGDGNLIIVLTNGSQINAGKVREIENQTVNENLQELDFYLKDNGTYGVAVGNASQLSKIEIPASYKGRPVMDIVDEGFKNCKANQIVIPDSITRIGTSAFSYSNLSSVTIPGSVTNIGTYAFFGCNELQKVTIENGVKRIEEHTFSDCNRLTDITIPQSINRIERNAFYGCPCVETYDGIDYVGNWIMHCDSSVTSAHIKEGTSGIAEDSFFECKNLTNINYTGTPSTWAQIYGLWNIMNSNRVLYINEQPVTDIVLENVSKINDYAFSGCKDLTSVTIGNGVTTIGNYAFSGCTNLKIVDIQEGVTSIWDSAFSRCRSLTDISIPDSVTFIRNEVFRDCSSLKNINVSENSTTYKSINGNLYTKDGKTLLQYAIGKTTTEFNIPDNVINIGWGAFYGCSNLHEITISDSVNEVAGLSFSECNHLEVINIGNGVTSIGIYAFYGCANLTAVNVSENNAKYKSVNGNLYSKDGKTLIQYAIGKTATEFTIPDGVTSIGIKAFSYCNNLKSIIIPFGVTNIGYGAFFYCSNLESITIDRNTTSIEEWAFGCCYSLADINYNGTMDEWNAIPKGIGWKDNIVSDCKVHCSDGNINI